MKKTIKDIRNEINKIDSNIVKLLSKRAELAKSIGNIKMNSGKDFYNPAREHNIYRSLLKMDTGIFPKKGIMGVFKEIQSACLSLETPLNIVYLGPKASYTHIASKKKFGNSAKYSPVSSIKEIFDEVERGSASYGIVPVENTTEGAITHTLDMFIEYNLHICAELTIRISHNLLSKERKLSSIKKIYSNAHAIAQCRGYIESKLPAAEIITVSSTAIAAKLASKEKNTAAIASSLASEVYKIKILDSNIEDKNANYTRFLVIGKNMVEKSSADKTSIVFSVKDEVGILHKMLKPFGENKINLSKIESRPSKTKLWEYAFFVDFDGHCDDKNVKKTLNELAKKCIFLKVLGSYPKEIGEDLL